MEILITNNIRVKDPDSKFVEWLKKNYTISNPEYETRIRLNLWLGNTPKRLSLYSKHPSVELYNIGYGCVRDILRFVRDNYPADEVELSVQLNEDQTADWSGNSPTLRDYQEKCVQTMLKKKFGIIKAPCSAGKTIMGHELAKRTGMRTLWVTHTKDLLNQSKEVGISMVGENNVGTITDGKVNIGNVITYTTVQTFDKMGKQDIKDKFNCVIVDECHRCNTKNSTTQMSRAVNAIAAEYKFGLSATPETTDGYFRSILYNLGNIEYEITEEELIENNRIMNVQIVPIYTNWNYPNEAYRSDGTLDFNKACMLMSADEKRNAKIIELINGRPTIILADTIGMLINIMNQLPEEYAKRACILCTKHNEDDVKDYGKLVQRKHDTQSRLRYLKMLADGELDIMFATYALAKEGLNVPRLEQVIFAFPAVSPHIITQSIGRVARMSEGKELAVCYDLVDAPSYFHRLWKERTKLYRKQNKNVIDLKEWGL